MAQQDSYDKGPPFGFTQDGARRIARATVVTEKRTRVDPRPQRNFGGYTNGGTKCALSNGITGGSLASPGSGTCTIYDMTLVTGTMVGTARTSNDNVYNNQGSSIPSGKAIKVTWVDGYWFVVNSDC